MRQDALQTSGTLPEKALVSTHWCPFTWQKHYSIRDKLHA